MGIRWESLGVVAVVSAAVAVVVVALVSFALVGWSARAGAAGGAQDGSGPPMSPALGTAVAAGCLLAVAAIVGYGLYVIVA